VGERIRETTSLLLDFPYIGREGALSGTRELVVPSLPYIVVYRVEIAEEETTVVILGVYHGAQLRPGQERKR
jgi:toxin ParE1/3/4